MSINVQALNRLVLPGMGKIRGQQAIQDREMAIAKYEADLADREALAKTRALEAEYKLEQFRSKLPTPYKKWLSENGVDLYQPFDQVQAAIGNLARSGKRFEAPTPTGTPAIVPEASSTVPTTQEQPSKPIQSVSPRESINPQVERLRLLANPEAAPVDSTPLDYGANRTIPQGFATSTTPIKSIVQPKAKSMSVNQGLAMGSDLTMDRLNDFDYTDPFNVIKKVEDKAKSDLPKDLATIPSVYDEIVAENKKNVDAIRKEAEAIAAKLPYLTNEDDVDAYEKRLDDMRIDIVNSTDKVNLAAAKAIEEKRLKLLMAVQAGKMTPEYAMGLDAGLKAFSATLADDPLSLATKIDFAKEIQSMQLTEDKRFYMASDGARKWLMDRAAVDKIEQQLLNDGKELLLKAQDANTRATKARSSGRKSGGKGVTDTQRRTALGAIYDDLTLAEKNLTAQKDGLLKMGSFKRRPESLKGAAADQYNALVKQINSTADNKFLVGNELKRIGGSMGIAIPEPVKPEPIPQINVQVGGPTIMPTGSTNPDGKNKGNPEEVIIPGKSIKVTNKAGKAVNINMSAPYVKTGRAALKAGGDKWKAFAKLHPNTAKAIVKESMGK